MENFKEDSRYVLENFLHSEYTYEQLFDTKASPKSQYKKVDYRDYYTDLDSQELKFVRDRLSADGLPFGYEVSIW